MKASYLAGAIWSDVLSVVARLKVLELKKNKGITLNLGFQHVLFYIHEIFII